MAHLPVGRLPVPPTEEKPTCVRRRQMLYARASGGISRSFPLHRHDATEGAVYVACSTLCFARYPLERALRIIGELEFSKVDVAIHEQGPHLKPSEVARDIALAAHRIRIGPSLTPAAFSVEIEASTDKEFEAQLQAICQLARLPSVAVLSLPAAPVGNGLDAEVKRLSRLVPLVQFEGIVLTVETRTGTVTETPEAAVELCERVPGLGLTLDPSHYVSGPHQGKNY